MAFKKFGDETPIIDFLDDNGRERFCSICGRKLTLIAVGEEENDFVCEKCNVKKEEITN